MTVAPPPPGAARQLSVPLASLMLAIGLQTAAAVWAAASAFARLDEVENRIATITAQGSPVMQVRVARLEEQFAAQHALLESIDRQLRDERGEDRRGARR